MRLDYDATGAHPHWVEIDAMKVSGKKEPDESIDITAVCQLCNNLSIYPILNKSNIYTQHIL